MKSESRSTTPMRSIKQIIPLLLTAAVSLPHGSLGFHYRKVDLFGTSSSRRRRGRLPQTFQQKAAFFESNSPLLNLRAGSSSKDETDEDEIDVDGDVSQEDTTGDQDDEVDEKPVVEISDGEELDEEEDEEEEELDEEEDEEEVDEEEEEEEEDDEDEDEEDEDETDIDTVDNKIDSTMQKFDEPLFPSPFASIYVTFGVMMIARRVDLSSPLVTKLARYVEFTPSI